MIVADHCYLSGRYRGPAHNKCNLEYQVPKFFPAVFHNLAGYDAHIFVKNLGMTDGKIKCIPKNEENYISSTKQIEVDTFESNGKTISINRTIRFDSFKFMASKLDKLAGNLNFSSFKFFHNMRSSFYAKEETINLTGLSHEQKQRILLKQVHIELLKLHPLKKKGIYPYDYMDCFEKLSETALPPIESFYSELNDNSISEDEHAQNIWKTFNMETMREYHDLYLKTDVLLLADVFENFRNVCLENYKLDPAWYYTVPGHAWDAALKVTK